MSAAKGTLDAGSGLLEQEEESIDESKLSWLERRRLIATTLGDRQVINLVSRGCSRIRLGICGQGNCDR